MYSMPTPVLLARTVNYYTVYVCVIQILFIFYDKGGSLLTERQPRKQKDTNASFLSLLSVLLAALKCQIEEGHTERCRISSQFQL